MLRQRTFEVWKRLIPATKYFGKRSGLDAPETLRAQHAEREREREREREILREGASGAVLVKRRSASLPGAVPTALSVEGGCLNLLS